MVNLSDPKSKIYRYGTVAAFGVLTAAVVLGDRSASISLPPLAYGIFFAVDASRETLAWKNRLGLALYPVALYSLVIAMYGRALPEPVWVGWLVSVGLGFALSVYLASSRSTRRDPYEDARRRVQSEILQGDHPFVMLCPCCRSRNLKTRDQCWACSAGLSQPDGHPGLDNRVPRLSGDDPP